MLAKLGTSRLGHRKRLYRNVRMRCLLTLLVAVGVRANGPVECGMSKRRGGGGSRCAWSGDFRAWVVLPELGRLSFTAESDVMSDSPLALTTGGAYVPRFFVWMYAPLSAPPR
jgi:hypothetical protein